MCPCVLLLMLTVTLSLGAWLNITVEHEAQAGQHVVPEPPEQGVWQAFQWDPLRTVGELKEREINPAGSAGGKAVWSCETSPEAEAKDTECQWCILSFRGCGRRGRNRGGTCRDEEIEEEWSGGLW